MELIVASISGVKMPATHIQHHQPTFSQEHPLLSNAADKS
jgi:hypothetical protein